MVWLATLATIVLLFGYEAGGAAPPAGSHGSAHAAWREDWFSAVWRHKGSEILGVPTLRNSLMSAT